MSSTNLLTEVTKLQKMISELAKSTTNQFTEQGTKIVDIISEMDFMKAQLALARLGGTIIGEIKWFGFSKDRLPDGYYFCGGGAYDINSPQGQALNSLDEVYKANMGIQVTDGKINLPNFFYQDGRGYFVRAVDGVTRQVGSIEQDAFQTHIHQWSGPQHRSGTDGNGAANLWNATLNANTTAPTTGKTSSETRPLNIGLTPAIFLGV